jgi:hypothetical protein
LVLLLSEGVKTGASRGHHFLESILMRRLHLRGYLSVAIHVDIIIGSNTSHR